MLVDAKYLTSQSVHEAKFLPFLARFVSCVSVMLIS